MSEGAYVGLDAILSRHGVGLSGEEFLAELDAGLSRTVPSSAAPLSSREVAFLAHPAARARWLPTIA